MKERIIYFAWVILTLASCNRKDTKMTMKDGTTTDSLTFESGYSEVNGLNMYYEIYAPAGQSDGEYIPLVLIHGGGSTIQTTFGRIIPSLAQHRVLIGVELQAHGRSGDRSTGISFEQDADDVARLLENLQITKADIFGFSNGGNTALQMAVRHPQLCNKIIAGSVLLKRDGTFPQFWEFMKNATFDQMPQQYKDAFLKVNPDSSKLMNMHLKCADRMVNFKEFSDEQIKSVKSPVLLINGDQDVATSEHIVAMSRLIPDCSLAIIPGGHGAYIGEITTLPPDYKTNAFIVPVIEKFLDEKPR